MDRNLIQKTSHSLNSKKFLIAIIVFMLFIIPIASAVEFEVDSEFDHGETFLAKISGNFIDPILAKNIFFYRGHVTTSVPFSILKIGEGYYIYAQLLDKDAGEYSIAIENVRYYEGSQIIDEDIIKNFTITNKTADFSVNPGFVITSEDFFIEAKNLQDHQITIKVKETETSEKKVGFFESLFGIGEDSERLITLYSGEIKKIDFEIGGLNETVINKVELSTENTFYKIPVYIIKNKTAVEKKEIGFKFEPSELNITLSTNSNATRIIYLINTGDLILENISLSVSYSLKQYTSLSAELIDKLNPNSSKKIELRFNSDDEEKIVEGQITAKVEENGNVYAYSAVMLNFQKFYLPIVGEGEIGKKPPVSQNCAEMGGVICDLKQNCTGKLERARDYICCIGECEEIKKSSAGKIIGWLMIIAVIGLLIWFFKKKYRGAKKEINLLEIAKGKR